MTSSLSYKLNKYLINIIDQYNIINFDILIKEIPKERKCVFYKLNNDLTIEDILIISYRSGYKGFCIGKKYSLVMKKIDLLMNNFIEKTENPHSFLYNFLNDTRDLFYADIIFLENVFSLIYECIDN